VAGERGAIFRFMADDHARLDALLRRATADPATIAAGVYAEFRRGLLRHIGMEEKILLPAIQRVRGAPLPAAARLRLDHGAIAALMVPTPTGAIVRVLRTILIDHNRLEEGPGGIYEASDEILAGEAEEILARLRAAPEVPVNPHVDSDLVRDATRRALARAGYDAAALG
jgi:hypothetical protein